MHSFPKKILISGQTHGNEWTGRYVAKQLGKIDLKAAYPNLEIKIILSNPKAFELNQRYVDQDLNRSFGEHQGLTNYEIIRAKEIKEQLKSFAQGDEVFIIDLHTTTSSMGSSLVLHNTLPENITVFSYLKKIMRIEHDESIHAYAWLEKKELNFLNSLSQFGFAIELGPVAQGTLCPNTYKKTMDLLLTTLKFLNKSDEAISNINSEEEIHVHIKSIDYPRDEGGDLSAMLHPQMLEMSFKSLKNETPVFQTFENENIFLSDVAGLTAVFINEAAYYEKSIAFSLCKKIPVKTVI